MALREPLKRLVVTSTLDIAKAEGDVIAVTKAEKFEHKKGPFKVEIA
jgi:hypothetical protein